MINGVKKEKENIFNLRDFLRGNLVIPNINISPDVGYKKYKVKYQTDVIINKLYQQKISNVEGMIISSHKFHYITYNIIDFLYDLSIEFIKDLSQLLSSTFSAEDFDIKDINKLISKYKIGVIKYFSNTIKEENIKENKLLDLIIKIVKSGLRHTLKNISISINDKLNIEDKIELTLGSVEKYILSLTNFFYYSIISVDYSYNKSIIKIFINSNAIYNLAYKCDDNTDIDNYIYYYIDLIDLLLDYADKDKIYISDTADTCITSDIIKRIKEKYNDIIIF